MSNVLKYTQKKDEPVIIKHPEVIAEAEEDTFFSAEDEQRQLMRNRASLEELRQETEEMHLRAQEEITKAEVEAKKILDAAFNEAALLKEEAQKEGHKQGYKVGLDDGKSLGHSQMQESIDEAVQKAENILTAVEAQAKKMMFDATDEIVDIAKMAVERALCLEALANPQAIVAIVKEALEKVRDHEQITIRVNPWNFELLLEHKHELQKMLGREYDLAITADKTIMSGGCVIDTSNGAVDASLDTKLELLTKSLEDVKNIERSKL